MKEKSCGDPDTSFDFHACLPTCWRNCIVATMPSSAIMSVKLREFLKPTSYEVYLFAFNLCLIPGDDEEWLDRLIDDYFDPNNASLRHNRHAFT